MQLDELKWRTAERVARYWSRMARPVWASVGATMFLLATLGAATAEPKQVLMLHSFGRDFKPWSEYARTIRAELDRQSPWPLEITEHSLMSARSSDENPEAPFVEYLRALHAKRPLDLIVSLGAPAVAFVQRHRQRLFADTPMVFTAVEQRRVQYSNLTPNDTVVAVAHSFPAVFENILRVLPDTKTVAVVNGNSPNEKFWSEEIRREEEWDCRGPHALGSRGKPPGCLRRHSHPWRRDGRRHQDASHWVCNTKIRLEGNAALGDPRKTPDARKRDLLS
jgi:hypothetical protein